MALAREKAWRLQDSPRRCIPFKTYGQRSMARERGSGSPQLRGKCRGAGRRPFCRAATRRLDPASPSACQTVSETTRCRIALRAAPSHGRAQHGSPATYVAEQLFPPNNFKYFAMWNAGAWRHADSSRVTSGALKATSLSVACAAGLRRRLPRGCDCEWGACQCVVLLQQLRRWVAAGSTAKGEQRTPRRKGIASALGASRPNPATLACNAPGNVLSRGGSISAYL